MNSKLTAKDLNHDLPHNVRINASGDPHHSFQPSISEKKFTMTEEEAKSGSSPIRRWFLDENGYKWLGKCSMASLHSYSYGKSYISDYFGDYKECLAMRLYSLFGATTPAITLSLQSLHQQDKVKFAGYVDDLYTPKLHVMSKFIDGFQELGENFIGDYKQSLHKDSYCYLYNKEKFPLKGFGRVIVIGILLHDYDCVGNSGGNMGYIINHEKKCAEIVKIDPGEALSFASDMSLAESLANPPEKREALLGTNGSRLNYAELSQDDQKELIQAAREILKTLDSKIEELFQPFLKLDERFQTILNHLLKRKEDLLNAFSPEVRTLIMSQVRELDERKAETLMTKWGEKKIEKSSLLTQQEFREKTDLILDNTRLRTISIEKNSHFVGRDSELLQLKKLFSENNRIIGCAIVGGAGLGKSQLAAEYVNRNREELYSHVIWLQAELSDLIPNQLQIYLQTYFKKRLTHDKMEKSKIVHQFYQTLSEVILNAGTKVKKKCCIILDNAENPEQVADYLPDLKAFPNLNIDILLTSRYQKWEKPFNTKIEMQAFGVDEIQTYINQYFPNAKKDDDDTGKSSDILRLNELLGGLPLAISQSIAYIKQKGITISSYCEQISNIQQEDDLKLGETESVSRNLPTLTLALAALRSKNQCVETILDILAYLSPDDINEELLFDSWKQYNRNHGLKTFDEALQLLTSYSIVTLNTVEPIRHEGKKDTNMVEGASDSIQIAIHRLTQQVIRLNHRRSGVYKRNYENVLDWVSARLNFDYKDMKDVGRAGLFVPHGMFLEGLPNTLDDQKMAALQESVGRHQLYVAGKYDLALQYLEKVLSFREKYLGKDHPSTGAILGDLGNAWGSLGDYEKQKDHFTRVLEIDEKHYGKDHPRTGATLGSLGVAWGSLGVYEKKKDFLTRALEIDENHYGRDHPSTGTTLTNLGNAWGALGDYEKKKDLSIRALEIFEKHYGKDHPQTASAMDSVGNAWGDFGDYQKKKDLLTQALEIFEKHYGRDHPETGATLGNLGNAWGSLGDYEKKKDLLSRALEIDEKHYGKDHPSTGAILGDLGNAWGSLGDYEKQKDLLTRVLEIHEKHYGKDHPRTGITLNNLGNAWGSLGDYVKQKDLLTRALEIFEKHYSKDHPQIGVSLASLGHAWGGLGDYEKKKDLLTQALEIFEKHYGKDHPETALMLGNFGIVWGSIGDYKKKKDLLTQALEITEKYYGKNHPYTCMVLTNLGNAWGDLGDYEKKKDILTQALEIFEKYFGKDHPDTGATLANLGNAWGALGNYKKQTDFLTRALEIQEKYYGKDHPQTGVILHNLGNAWGYLGDYKKQKDILTRALELFKKYYGEDHPQTANTLGSLGNAWGGLDDYGKQKDLLTQALEIYEKNFGKDHPQTTTTLVNLGNAWGGLGDHEKKKDLLTRVLAIQEKHSGKDHPQTGITLSNLGCAWGDLGDYEKAESFLTRARNIFLRCYPSGHPFITKIKYCLDRYSKISRFPKNKLSCSGNINQMKKRNNRIKVFSWSNLANNYLRPDKLKKFNLLGKTALTRQVIVSSSHSLSKEYGKQREYLEQIHHLGLKKFEKNRPLIALILFNRATALRQMKNYEDQKSLLAQALLMIEQEYGASHPLTGVILSNLSNDCLKMKANEDSLFHQRRACEIFREYFGEAHKFYNYSRQRLHLEWI